LFGERSVTGFERALPRRAGRQGTITRDITLPHVLGSDACGVIAEVGPGVTGFATGDRVIPMPGYPLDERDDSASPLSAAPTYAIGGILRWGTYAEYVEAQQARCTALHPAFGALWNAGAA
jgi:NADPH:quinone reductase-like Zn-dependent oxidoreductase